MEELSYTKLEELVKAKYGGVERIKRNLDRILASGPANRPVSGSASSNRNPTRLPFEPSRRPPGLSYLGNDGLPFAPQPDDADDQSAPDGSQG